MNRDRFLNCAALAFAIVCVYSMGWAAVREQRTVAVQAQAVHACKSVLEPIEMLVHPPKGTTHATPARPAWGHPTTTHPGMLQV